jgi:hypothetical protein
MNVSCIRKGFFPFKADKVEDCAGILLIGELAVTEKLDKDDVKVTDKPVTQKIPALKRRFDKTPFMEVLHETIKPGTLFGIEALENPEKYGKRSVVALCNSHILTIPYSCFSFLTRVS